MRYIVRRVPDVSEAALVELVAELVGLLVQAILWLAVGFFALVLRGASWVAMRCTELWLRLWGQRRRSDVPHDPDDW